MKLSNKWVLICLTAAFTACKQDNTGVLKISGEVKNIEAAIAQFPGAFASDSMKLLLYEIPFGNDAAPVKLDSVYVSKKNPSFELKGQVTHEGLFDVMVENGPMIPVVNDNSDIRLDIDMLEKVKYYSVSGSKASEQLRDFINGYSEKGTDANGAFKRLDSLKMYNASDSLLLQATDKKNQALTSIHTFIQESIGKTEHPVVATFILGTGSNSMPEAEYETALNKASEKYPSDAGISYLKNQLEERRKAQTQSQETSWIGKPAPDMVMPDVNGKEVSLASFKGKYVLVDFWASWCGPCREENPNVVRAYHDFKNKNFTVLGVSLDKEKDNWIQAIEKDHLTWTHISDLAFWNSKSVDLFKFQGIPYNVLVDPNGIIVGEGLRGDGLITKLKEVLK